MKNGGGGAEHLHLNFMLINHVYSVKVHLELELSPKQAETLGFLFFKGFNMSFKGYENIFKLDTNFSTVHRENICEGFIFAVFAIFVKPRI